MQPINKTTLIHDTYYVEQKQSNANGRVSLAIQPMINCEANLISWQDSTLHPKSMPFKSIEIGDNTRDIKIITNDKTILNLKLLTLDVYNRCIGGGNINQKALISDESLRGWYLDFINDPANENLYCP